MFVMQYNVFTNAKQFLTIFNLFHIYNLTQLCLIKFILFADLQQYNNVFKLKIV